MPELMPNLWEQLADQALAGECLTLDDSLAVLGCPDDEVLALLNAVFRVRRRHFGRRVRLNSLINAKSGHCSQDCGYCAQSSRSRAAIETYPLVDTETLVEHARRTEAAGGGTYCIVGSGHSPRPGELDRLLDAVRTIKATTSLKVCLSLGILNEEQARRLKQAGVDRYNHNLNTSREHHPKLTTTHSYEDRVRTVQAVQRAGLSACSGVIVGTGEADADVVRAALALRELRPGSIPINFLHPVPGTPLGSLEGPSPQRCLKVLSLFRLICPDREIRVAGGRELNLRSLQPLALYAANSIFLGGYLTTGGQEPQADLAMIADLGFEIEREHDLG
jgi:biotin synthase